MFPLGSSGSAPAWKATTLIPLNASLRSANSNSDTRQWLHWRGQRLYLYLPLCPAAVKYPGIGRFAYAGGHLGRVALSYVLAFLAALYEMSHETLMSAVTFMASGTAFALTFGRLQNLGKSLWCLGIWLNLPAPALTHHRRQNHTRWRKSGPTAPAPRLAGPPWAC